ncbi:MAG: hypothetical protein AAB646_00965 [Patescibacteria group bacterium]
MAIKVIESPAHREQKIVNIAKETCPDLVLASRADEWLLTHQFPKLRFEKPLRFRKFLKLFWGWHQEKFSPLIFTIIGRRQWQDIEIRVYDHSFLDKVKEIAAKCEPARGGKVSIVLENVEKKSPWQPFINLSLILTAFFAVSFGVRLVIFYSILELLKFL